MKRIKSIIIVSLIVFLIPFAIASGQEKKTEQRIKIVIADDGGSGVILDTLITGKPLSDTLILKNGKTIYLAHEGPDDCKGAPQAKKYIITASSPDGSDKKQQITREITVISSDSDAGVLNWTEKDEHTGCGPRGTDDTYAYKIESGDKVSDSEKTKYVITRDGIRITVEGSDYDKVKDVIKDIEKTLDSKSEVK